MYYIEKKRFYEYDDIQHMLNFLYSSQVALSKMKHALEGYSRADINAILYTISERSAECFDRYDSAVAETFVREFERCFLLNDIILQYYVIKHDGAYFEVIDLEDGAKETLTKSDLVEAKDLDLKIGNYNIMVKHKWF